MTGTRRTREWIAAVLAVVAIEAGTIMGPLHDIDGLFYLALVAFAFRPRTPGPSAVRIGPTLVATIALSVLPWAIVRVRDLQLFVPLWFLGLYALARVVGRRACLVALALSPLSWAFLSGLRDYVAGEPVLRTFGLRHGASLDPTTRARVGSVGCMVDGTEWIEHDPYNLALRAATAVGGVAPGLYDGPLPNADEARHILASEGRDLAASELESDRIAFYGRRIQLVAGTGELFEAAVHRDLGFTVDRSVPIRRAALVGRRLLLIGFATEELDWVLGFDARMSRLVQIDLHGGRGVHREWERVDIPPVDRAYVVVRQSRTPGGIRAEFVGHDECSVDAVDSDALSRRLFDRIGRCSPERLGDLVFFDAPGAAPASPSD